MIRGLLLFWLAALFSGGVSALSLETPQGYRFLMINAGAESRLERNQEQNIVDRQLRSYAAGIGYSDFVFSMEYSSFKETTGQSSLIVDRTVENYILWGTWGAGEWLSMIPYLGAGIGQSIETVDTTLLNTKSRDKGKPQWTGGGCLGLRANMPYLWVTLEARVLAAERWDPNPTAGFAGRVGFYF